MPRNMGYVWIAFAAVTFLLAVGPGAANQQERCDEAKRRLLPCVPFLVGTASNVTDACCAGASTLGTLLGNDTAMVLKPVCHCLKQGAVEVGVKTERVPQVSLLCNVALTIFFDPQIDCYEKTTYDTYLIPE